MEVIKFDKIENKIIELRTTQVILDSDVAELYGVQTKDINRAVSNNPDKFPDGYLFELNSEEKQEVVKKFNHLEKLKFSPYLPKAFTERAYIFDNSTHERTWICEVTNGCDVEIKNSATV